MDSSIITPILTQLFRDFLRTAGAALLAHGVIQNGAGVEAFVGAGMTLGGILWGWWTTKGYLEADALVKQLTTKSPSIVPAQTEERRNAN